MSQQLERNKNGTRQQGRNKNIVNQIAFSVYNIVCYIVKVMFGNRAGVIEQTNNKVNDQSDTIDFMVMIAQLI